MAFAKQSDFLELSGERLLGGTEQGADPSLVTPREERISPLALQLLQQRSDFRGEARILPQVEATLLPSNPIQHPEKRAQPLAAMRPPTWLHRAAQAQALAVEGDRLPNCLALLVNGIHVFPISLLASCL
jgi:hypothetical protein